MMDSNELYTAIGATIRQRRKKLKITQEKLAPLVGMSRASLANIETGRQNLLVHQLISISSALCMEPKDLLPIQTAEHNNFGRSDGVVLPKKGLSKKQRAQILGVIQQEPTKSENT